MKKQYLLVGVICFTLIISGTSSAQMVGANCFLQSQFLEVGISGNGSWGPTGAPGTYHTRGGTNPNNLASVYDYGHDGWGVPAGNLGYYGDYTTPGTNFEGWGLQVNGVRMDAFQSMGPAAFWSSNAGASTLSGSNVSSTVVGGVATGVWQGQTTGTSGGLSIRQTTRLEPGCSWATVTTEFTNTSAAPLPGVYYWRTCDPDDDVVISGNYVTNNSIPFQNDAAHRVMAASTGQSRTNAFLALATKDCRAKAFLYTQWATYPTQAAANTLDRIWNQNAPFLGTQVYNLNGTQNGDYAIGLIYNIGTINPGATAVISYAYVYNNINGIDSAFPEPQLVTNGVPIAPTAPAPAPTVDTFHSCGTGLTVLPVHINFADDKNWTNSSWTWSPSTGLSSTTGVTNSINLASLPPIITYTITGNDSNINMMSCNYRVMYLTVTTCNGATINDPCVGDSLIFNAPGDSTGATYAWYGPAPSTTIINTNQTFVKYPATMADTGRYFVIKTVGTVSDTSSAVAVVHPLPITNVVSSIGMCALLSNTLSLSVNPDSVGNTYSWSGPNGFTSTVRTPDITPFDSTGAGTYVVDVTSRYGCRKTGSVNVYPGVDIGFTYRIKRGCVSDTVYFENNTINASTYSWDFGDGSPAVTSRHATHIYTTRGLWSVKLTGTNPHCSDALTLQVDTRHDVTADFTPSPDTLCINQPVTFIDNSSATVGNGLPGVVISSVWDFGDGSALDSSAAPTHSYTQAGIYTVKLTVTDSIGCQSTTTRLVIALRVEISSFGDTTLCLRQPLPLTNMVILYPLPSVSNNFTFSWAESEPNLDNPNVQVPYLSGFGTFTDVLTATIQPWGCSDVETITVHSVEGKVLSNVSPDATISYGSSIQLNSGNEVYYHWVPNDGSIDNPNINNPNVTPLQTTTYTVYGMDQYGCVDSAFVTIRVDSTLNEAIPSAFTPNGDGLNDVFRPIGIKYQRLVEFRVYNRWGQQVFYTRDANEGWDGTHQGVPQDLGVYHYHVIVAHPDGTNVVYKGDVTLIR